MTNFFLEELRKIYGDGRVIHDPQFVGECCYGSLGDLRVKARFTKDIVANQYPYLTVSILNPAKGEIDSVRMKIGDIISRSCRSTNPNLRNTEPHIWVDGKTPQWYACCPGSRDYTLLANATAYSRKCTCFFQCFGCFKEFTALNVLYETWNVNAYRTAFHTSRIGTIQTTLGFCNCLLGSQSLVYFFLTAM